MRKKKDIPTLGLIERVKKTRPHRSGVGAAPRGSARVKPNPDQVLLMPPESNWERPTELPDLHGVDEIALDTETVDKGIERGLGPGWAFGLGHVAGVGVAWREGTETKSIYAPVSHPDSDNFPKEQVARWVTDITRNKRVVLFNAGYDIGWLHTDMNIPIPPFIDDASCAAFLVDENREDLSLDGVCAWRGVRGKDLAKLHEAALAYGYTAKKAVANIGKLPARYAAEYGAQDPASTLLVMDSLRPELAAQGLLQAYATEMRLVPLMHAMRKRGIRIDIDRAVRFQANLVARAERALADLSERLKMKTGIDDVRSHLWLNKTFSMEGVQPKKIGGKATFDRDWMRRAEHWLPRLCAEARQCMDMADKFVGKYLLDFANNGRVHASVNQWKYEEGGTRSHRLSYADPPLQQAPSRGEAFDGWPLTQENATEYRSCFFPEEGQLWFSPDYSQQEYRHIVADSETLGLEKATDAAEMYRKDPKTDFHNLVVGLTGLPRYNAKACNFAKAFGAGAAKFAEMISKPVKEAEEIMGTYDREMPFVKQLAARCQSLADRRGYIKLFDGARSHFDKWEVGWLDQEERMRGYAEGHHMNACSLEEAKERQKIDGHPWQGQRLKRAFTHKAMNRRIQGSAARQMKLAMAQCWDEGLVPLLQMHDELSFSLDNQKDGERIVEIMRTVYTCSVPFLVDADWGKTWGDAKHSFKVAEADWRENRKGGRGRTGSTTRTFDPAPLLKISKRG
jgi:DNA polymerase I-like protein with 3'-5' exonuclease and polymerase domains